MNPLPMQLLEAQRQKPGAEFIPDCINSTEPYKNTDALKAITSHRWPYCPSSKDGLHERVVTADGRVTPCRHCHAPAPMHLVDIATPMTPQEAEAFWQDLGRP